MKRAAALLCSVLFLWFALEWKVCAEESIPYDTVLADLLEASGTEELLEEQGLSDKLSDYGISTSEPETLTGLSFSAVLEDLFSQFTAMLHAPLRTFMLLIGVILLSSFVTSLQHHRNDLTELFEIICVLCAVGMIVEPISEVFVQVSQALEQSAGFMLGFSGIFGAVLTVSGGITAAAGYQMAMVAVCQLVMQIVVHWMLPLLGMCMAMGIVDAVNPIVSLQGMIHLLQKAIVWLLGFLMAVFLGFLTLQSMVGLSADQLTSKTSKFVISNAIPFVGGAVSDAYGAVLGSLGVLRSSTGMIGVISLLLLLLPVLMQLGIFRLLVLSASAVSELFAAVRLSRLMKNMESVLTAAFSIAVSFSIMFIVSTAVMLLLGASLQH